MPAPRDRELLAALVKASAAAQNLYDTARQLGNADIASMAFDQGTAIAKAIGALVKPAPATTPSLAS